MYSAILFGISRILIFSLCNYYKNQISAASREENNAICPQTTILRNLSYKNTFLFLVIGLVYVLLAKPLNIDKHFKIW